VSHLYFSGGRRNHAPFGTFYNAFLWAAAQYRFYFLMLSKKQRGRTPWQSRSRNTNLKKNKQDSSLPVFGRTAADNRSYLLSSLFIRWCERCFFTSRCLTYAMEAEDRANLAIHDLNNEAFWDKSP
jgi:hypothetical protein